ncbi:fatty acid desaturase [Dyadobacter sandarakinus]|uniref:fatty acid desaturase n=1 Tax=Dyadobacter sandarakinus TaxID=2747268 RepID=UPI00286E44B6|nr:fatty acid desaturase [Dyadobacter sandarakinus]
MPSYGWQDSSGQLIKPTAGQIIREFFRRINIFESRKNWLPFFSWFRVICILPLFYLFLFKYMSVGLLVTAFLYSMIIMGTHGTIWHHRYCTHQAYKFSNRFWLIVTKNLTISMVPEEIYTISHHVHHAKSDKPGDPYNAEAGFLYCFLADVNHQPISTTLTEKQYHQVSQLMRHTGVKGNTYAQYLKWGSYSNPVREVTGWLLNWAFWFCVFYAIGGFALVCTLFGAAGFWAVGVRTFNYEGHGKGENKQRDGIDLNNDDKSINQLWPGLVAGEWHNNHHLYPSSARSGFLPYQFDLAWYYIRFLSAIKAVSSFRDSKGQFYEEHYRPYLRRKEEGKKVEGRMEDGKMEEGRKVAKAGV